MAWTGSATVTKINDKLVRITGLSLAKDASGTIGFAGEAVAADVELPDLPDWLPRAGFAGQPLQLSDLIEVQMTLTTDVTVGVPISVGKGGTSQNDFKLTFHNDTDATTGDTSAVLEIYIAFH